MNRSEREISCSWAQERIEAHLDGELPDGEINGLETHLRECEICAGELELAERVRGGLRMLQLQRCPDPVVEGVYEQIRGQLRATRRQRLREWLDSWRAPLWRPVAAALVVVLMIGGTVSYQNREPEVSPAELARAEQQVKWTLAYLSQMGRRTGDRVRDDVLRERVVAPIQNSVNRVMEMETM
jgi:anti-sigma factor (TIGR02949 family)